MKRRRFLGVLAVLFGSGQGEQPESSLSSCTVVNDAEATATIAMVKFTQSGADSCGPVTIQITEMTD